MLKKVFTFLVALSAWSGLAIMAYVVLTENILNDRLLSVTNIISYFTVQSNIMVAVVATYILVKGESNASWFKLLKFGALVNIAITGLVYAFVLSGIWKPEGIVFVYDALLHYVTPLLFVVYWAFFLDKKVMSYRYALYWLAYPVLYFAYTLVRGSIVNWYPYPFVDASKLNTTELIVNALVMGVAFVIAGLIFIWINNLQAKK